MLFNFYKYQGTGNDFIIRKCFDNSEPLNQQSISSLCDRKKGVGSDGYIEILPSNEADFEMRYFNSDGLIGSMCGNGGRCAMAFAHHSGLVGPNAKFRAYDGIHFGLILGDKSVKISMSNVAQMKKFADDFFIDTGSPHYIKFVEDLDSYPVFEEGKKIRNSIVFKTKGTNVNFVEQKNNQFFVRTYERGVEDETLSCGTGVTAVALVLLNQTLDFDSQGEVKLVTRGGELCVSAKKNSDGSFSEIFLQGPVEFVFKGEISL